MEFEWVFFRLLFEPKHECRHFQGCGEEKQIRPHMWRIISRAASAAPAASFWTGNPEVNCCTCVPMDCHGVAKIAQPGGDRSATLGTMTAQTISEYLEEEREKLQTISYEWKKKLRAYSRCDMATIAQRNNPSWN
jgi:hypothetical protein